MTANLLWIDALRKGEANFDADKNIEIFEKWRDNKQRETEVDLLFLEDIFGKCLGYKMDANIAHNLKVKNKTQKDAKTPDANLGFFDRNNNDFRVVIELKDSKTKDLDKVCDQAFGYNHKYEGGVEWVIISNMDEIRLYHQSNSMSYHSWTLSELSADEEIRRQFYFALSSGNLFTKKRGESQTHKILLTERSESIKGSFYTDYKNLRIKIANSLLTSNPEKTPNFCLYKSQKLLDRVVFIKFCKENEALDSTSLEKALKVDIYDPTADVTKYGRLKAFFNSMNVGNPQIGIAKFNGGLFSPDELMDNLCVSDDIVTSIVNLYDKDFGSKLSVDILGHIFEQSISDMENLTQNSKDARKSNGVFYTPEKITDYVSRYAIDGWLKSKGFDGTINQAYVNNLKSIKIVDPACGSGAYLVKVFDILEEKWKKVHEKGLGLEYTYKEILNNNIYGVDLNVASVGITKLSLWLKTVHNKDSLVSLDNNIKVGNSLISDKTAAGKYSEIDGGVVYGNARLDSSPLLECLESQESANKNELELGFDWDKEFPFKFDVVVGNPPYVRHESILKFKPELKRKYGVYSGKADLLLYFFELGFNLLKDGGKLGFITSNKWMTAEYGIPTRSFIKSKTTIDQLIDFGGKKIFKGVGVDSCILLFTKKSPEGQKYNLLSGSDIGQLNEKDSSLLFGSQVIGDKSDVCFSVTRTKESYELQKKLESFGTPLQDWKNLKINRGILTGLNDAFIIDTETKNRLCKEDLKSAEIIKKAIRGKDVGRYKHKWDDIWIIDSHNGYNVDVENEDAIKTKSTTTRRVPSVNVKRDYKAIYKHLLKYKEACEKRSDKGDHWTNLRNCAYHADFAKSKIIWQEMSDEPSISVSENMEEYILNTGYIMICDEYWYMSSILNSRVVNWYISITATSFGDSCKRWTKQYVIRTPIPAICKEEMLPFEDNAKKMIGLTSLAESIRKSFIDLLLSESFGIKATDKIKKWHRLTPELFISEITKQNKSIPLLDKGRWLQHFKSEKDKYMDIASKIEKIDHEIDEMVYKLYNLTPEEIQIVSGV